MDIVEIDVPRLIRDLRSGEFKQGQNTLNNVSENTYCCLGVACSALEKDGILDSTLIEDAFDDDAIIRKYFLTDAIYNARLLPEFIEFPAGMQVRGSNGILPDPFRGHDGAVFSLAELNDNGFTFAQIADILDYLYTNNVRSN